MEKNLKYAKAGRSAEWQNAGGHILTMPFPLLLQDNTLQQILTFYVNPLSWP
jgi:hypothetical protein